MVRRGSYKPPPHDVNGDGINLLVDPVQRSLIYKLHANANARVRDERAIQRNDARRVSVVHGPDPQLKFPYGCFCAGQHDLSVRPYFMLGTIEKRDCGWL